jgi:hypothetical protein
MLLRKNFNQYFNGELIISAFFFCQKQKNAAVGFNPPQHLLLWFLLI